MIYLAVIPGLVVGFLAGLFAFRVKARWCPVCGNDTVALADRVRHTHREPHPRGVHHAGRDYRVPSSSIRV